MTKAELKDLATRAKDTLQEVLRARHTQRVIDDAHADPRVKKAGYSEQVLNGERARWRIQQREKLGLRALPLLAQAKEALQLRERLTSRDAVLARASYAPPPRAQPDPNEMLESYRPSMKKQRSDGSWYFTEPGPLHDAAAYRAQRDAVDSWNLQHAILAELKATRIRTELRDATPDELVEHVRDAVAAGDLKTLDLARRESVRRVRSGALKDIDAARVRSTVEKAVAEVPLPDDVAEFATEFDGLATVAAQLEDASTEVFSGKRRTDAEAIAAIREHGPEGARAKRDLDAVKHRAAVDAYVEKLLRRAAVDEEAVA